MSEPYWSALGAKQGGVDYKGAWAAGTAYAQGDVVVYQGVTYLAVNPSTGVTPAGGTASDIGTVLPSSPLDGAEFTLVDSLTAPTYSWKFRYVAAKASNKWVFIGGAPISAEVSTQDSLTSSVYAAMPSPGPSITVPRAGDYDVSFGAVLSLGTAGDQTVMMSYDVGATPAADAWCVSYRNQAVAGTNPNPGAAISRTNRHVGVAASAALVCKYKTPTGLLYASSRWMRVLPVALT